MNFKFYLTSIYIHCNSHMWLVAAILDSAGLNHILFSSTILSLMFFNHSLFIIFTFWAIFIVPLLTWKFFSGTCLCAKFVGCFYSYEPWALSINQVSNQPMKNIARDTKIYIKGTSLKTENSWGQGRGDRKSMDSKCTTWGHKRLQSQLLI